MRQTEELKDTEVLFHKVADYEGLVSLQVHVSWYLYRLKQLLENCKHHSPLMDHQEYL